MLSLIHYFTKRHLLSNILFFGIIIFAYFSWQSIGKEEMPEFESNWIRVNAFYPGAPAEDVELFVTKPIEDELKGIAGIDEINTTSSVGSSSIRITLDDDYPEKADVVQDIKDAVLRTNLPSEVRDLPKIRQFKSAEKAILDIGIHHKNQKFLSVKDRQELQKYVLSFESQILALKEISSISRSHYRKPELQVIADPKKIKKEEISLSEIRTEIRRNNVRVPIGSMKDKGESKVTALNELETVDALEALTLRSNFEGGGISLKDVATVQEGFESSNSIFKINGHEGVFLNVRKNVSTDIITAQKAVMDFIENFRRSNKDAPIEVIFMDDESYDVTNRLDIVSKNGVIGFFLIILVLLVFLNLKAGFWVAMGIPFCIAFTLIVSNLLGYTINNMTLAGIIIVLGIVVDDAIIIAENISRFKEKGLSSFDAAVQGSYDVFRPILASILTTCAAFIPLIFFEGFFGKLVSYIPLIVILMLIASLLESVLILPSHMSEKNKLLDRNYGENVGHWFHKIEKKYEGFLVKLLKHRFWVLGLLLTIMGTSALLYSKNMKFVMFPREESKEVFIKVSADKKFLRHETAKAIQPLEMMFVNDKENVVAVRSTIGLSRRGSEARENEASILVELIPANNRPTPLNELLDNWEKKSKEFPGLKKVRFLRGRWGHSSGSAIEIQIQENNDKSRAAVVQFLEEKMKEDKDITDVEIEKPLLKNEYMIQLNQRELSRLNVDPSAVTSTLRSFVEGTILYDINKGDEEVTVKLSVPDKKKKGLENLLELKVKNRTGQLVYLRNVVSIKNIKKPVSIKRSDFKRSTMIYGNPEKGSKVTPLQIAQRLEEDVFPEIINKYPTAVLKFKGEIEDSRESQGQFKNSVTLVLILIYMILMVVFNSLGKPLLVLSVVPFGLAGVIFTLLSHGMTVYGFFAAIGALGMIGVVINDAIVMIDKLDKTKEDGSSLSIEQIAQVASTRLRPILVTTLTTVVGVLPTAYGIAGYDSMLAEMMLTMGWGLVFGTVVTLVYIPVIYTISKS